MPKVAARHPEYRDDQREFFDELITSRWDTYLDRRWDAARRFEVSAVMRRTGPVDSVLDVGCGCGFHDVAFAEGGAGSVVGIDPSPRSVEVALREYPHPRVERRVADVLEMDDPGGYGLVVSFQVIEHLSHQEDFLRACARQVAPGGFVAIATPNRRSLANRIRVAVGRPPALVDPQHYAEFAAAELAAMGTRVGLKPIGVLGRGLTVPGPRMGRALLPNAVALRAGALMPAVADVICVLFRRP